MSREHNANIFGSVFAPFWQEAAQMLQDGS